MRGVMSGTDLFVSRVLHHQSNGKRGGRGAGNRSGAACSAIESMDRSDAPPSYGAVDRNAAFRLDTVRQIRDDRLDGGAPISRGHLVDTTSAVPDFSLQARGTKSWRVAALLCSLCVAFFVAAVHLSANPPPAAAPHGEDTRLESASLFGRRSHPKETYGFLGGAGPGETASTAALPLAFTALNFYHVRDGKPGQEYPWLKDIKLVEPYRSTTLAVTDARDGFSYRWSIRAGDIARGQEVLLTASGEEAVVVFTKLEENVITLEEVGPDGMVARRLEEVVIVKYVRREIRTLADDEREELLDAMSTLWKVEANGGGGRELYGEQYTDVWSVNSLHYSAASEATCDHFHDGLGFLTSHFMMSNTFEYSLQLVNPKLTLPYWDFTIETSEEFMSRDGVDDAEPQRQSPLLQPSWFGGSDTRDHQVKDGRWAYTKIPATPNGIQGDVFQRLRSPWNMNKRPYLTRGLGETCGFRIESASPWPTCKKHYDLLTQHSDFYGWVWDAQYDPHGTVHIWLGGVLDCDEKYAEIAGLVGTNAGAQLAMLSFIHRKNLYRSGIFECRSTVDLDNTAEASPDCGCLSFDLEKGSDYQLVVDNLIFVEEILEDFDENTIREVVARICNTPLADGDHLQSSSPLDPTFWPIHPTMERLWLFKVLTGTMTDLSWPDQDTTSIDPADGSQSVKRLSLYTDSCFGHRGSDVFPFGLLDDIPDFSIRSGIYRDGVSRGNTLSNRQVLQALDPRVNELPYVYDTFKWLHCEAEGIHFDDTWETSSDSAAHQPSPPSSIDSLSRYSDGWAGSVPVQAKKAHSGFPKR